MSRTAPPTPRQLATRLAALEARVARLERKGSRRGDGRNAALPRAPGPRCLGCGLPLRRKDGRCAACGRPLR